MSVDPKTQSLFDAIAAVSYDRVKLAIDSGAAVNTPNHRGQTPLALACRQGNLEIVDLLVAAGAQMQAQQNPASVLPIAVDVDASQISDAGSNLAETEISASPDRQISFENLIDLIDRPTGNNTTEIEQFMPIVPKASFPREENTDPDRLDKSSPSVPMQARNLDDSKANWQDMTSNPEDTYTFDLDKVFNENENLNENHLTLKNKDMFVDSEITMTSFQHPADRVEFEPGETYAFDLSPDLERLTAEADREPDCLSIPMGSWGDTETCILDDFSESISELEVENSPEQTSQGMSALDTMFEMDEDALVVNDTWEEGETYAIDLEDLNLYKQMLGQDLTAESSGVVGGVSTATQVAPSREDRHLLAEIDSSLFPVIAGDDEPDYDPDTQTSTDIFGQVALKQDDEVDRTGGYEENSTNTSLMAAVIDGDLDLAQQAIEVGASLDRYDWNLGYSPLGMSIDRGHTELVGCLLAAGANPHCGNIGTTALGLAAERGEVEMIQMLLPRGLNVNEPVGQDGWTALLSAIKNGHRSVVQLLVTAGANVNVWSRGETPILLAAKCEEREIYNYLYPLVNTSIRLCADRDGEQLLQSTRKRRIREQNRPVEKFIEMATMGNIDEINRAIEVGVEIDEIGAKGHTALMAAAYYGHRSIVNILLAAGANPNLLSDDDGLGTGMTALMLTAGSFFASNRQQVMKLLIAGGADVNQRGAGGKTAIFYAALAGSGYADCVETAIAAGANLDLRDDRGHTVLTAVAAAENYQILNLLIQAGASTTGLESIQLIQAASAGNIEQVQSLLATKVNLDLDRGAAIGNASAAGHTKIVELLIHAGANVNLRDKLGFAPISSAAYAGYGEIVKLLIDAGADIQAPAIGSQRYSALEYAQMGLYQFDAGASGQEKRRSQRDDLQHAQIIRQLERLSV